MAKSKSDDKWVTPVTLQAILKENGENVPLTTISTWISRKLIPSKEIQSGESRRRYLVDKTKIPERRAPGRPYSFKGRSGVQMLRECVAFLASRPEVENEGKSPTKLLSEYAATISKK
jgi:hypothetical protein